VVDGLLYCTTLLSGKVRSGHQRPGCVHTWAIRSSYGRAAQRDKGYACPSLYVSAARRSGAYSFVLDSSVDTRLINQSIEIPPVARRDVSPFVGLAQQVAPRRPVKKDGCGAVPPPTDRLRSMSSSLQRCGARSTRDGPPD
jgi:hypothetical protein